MKKLLILSFSLFFLAACGGGSGGKETNNTVSVTETKVVLNSTWNATFRLSPCPDLTANYTTSLNDTDNNGLLNTWTRYTGTLININTCTIETFDTNTADISTLNTKNTVNQAELRAFLLSVIAVYYGIAEDDINLVINIFEENHFKYTAIAGTITEIGEFTK